MIANAVPFLFQLMHNIYLEVCVAKYFTSKKHFYKTQQLSTLIEWMHGLASFPGLPRLQFLIAPFLHTASNQKLEAGKGWERG